MSSGLYEPRVVRVQEAWAWTDARRLAQNIVRQKGFEPAAPLVDDASGGLRVRWRVASRWSGAGKRREERLDMTCTLLVGFEEWAVAKLHVSNRSPLVQPWIWIAGDSGPSSRGVPDVRETLQRTLATQVARRIGADSKRVSGAYALQFAALLLADPSGVRPRWPDGRWR